MTAQHPGWDKLWKRIQYLLEHNPAWLRKNINRRVKQILCSARVQQRQTNVTLQHPKHPDWDELWEKVQNGDRNWLRDYIKSHDINQCTDEYGNTLLHYAVCDENPSAITCLFYLIIDPNIKNAAGQTALQLAQDADADCLWALHQLHLCIDFAQASSEPNGLDALFAAIYRGDAALGDTSGVTDDGNEKNAGWSTALHCAAMYGRPHLIRELHQRFPKLDADCLNYNKCSALRRAAKYGHSNCIIALCECFPAIKAGAALQTACAYNRSACIPTLRQCFPQLTGNELEGNLWCSSALMRAAKYNHHECIRALHSCFPDIDPNLQDEDGNTALIVAMQYPGSPESIPVLFECFPNIDPNKQDNNGNTALLVAMQYPGSPECIPVLFECFPNIDPNKQDNNGNTALMRACQRGSQSITSLATYFPSIDVNMRNTDDKTALMLAIERNCDEKCFMTLCESFPNLDPNVQDKHGETALMVAVRQNINKPEPIVSQLLKLFPNLDPNAQGKYGQTILMIAANRPNPGPIISQLRQLFPNIDPNKQDQNKDTALMRLVRSCYRSIDESVRHFLDTFPHVDINIQNAKGETALALAIEKGRAPIVALLLERFPDIISLTNPAGQTALMLEIKKNRIYSISMLLKLIAQMQ